MSGETKEKISKENLKNNSKSLRITSPLSIQACKLQGVTPEDLKYLTFEQYLCSHPESINLPKEFQQERYDNYEHNRKDLIKSVKQRREDLKKFKERQLNKRTMSEEFDSDKLSIGTGTIDGFKSIEDLKKKLKYDMENNIKVLIDKEIERKNKSFAKSKRDFYQSKNKNENRLEILKKEKKEKYESETKANKEKNYRYQQYLNEKKEKLYLEKDLNIKRHIKEMRTEIKKKRFEESEQRKEKATLTLNRNEEKMQEKINTFYKMKREREERIEKREKERKYELNKKYQEEKRRNTERLKAAILKEEEFKNKKYEQYNKRINDVNRNLYRKEIKDKEKQMRQRTINELKESQFNKRKMELKSKEKEEKEKYYQKQEKLYERMRKEKEDKEREKMVKLNREFISSNNLRIKHLREANANEYKLMIRLENMDKRRQLLKELKEKKIEEKVEQRKLKEEIHKDKQAMMERLKEIMGGYEIFTKDEINNYVFYGIKPKKNKRDEINRNKTIDKDNMKRPKIKDDEEYDEKKAFITGIPEN